MKRTRKDRERRKQVRQDRRSQKLKDATPIPPACRGKVRRGDLAELDLTFSGQAVELDNVEDLATRSAFAKTWQTQEFRAKGSCN